MSTFSTQEVEALQKGGNQRAKESFLKDFDTQKMRLPDSSNIGSLREFIKAVYVERRYAGGRFSERPPRDKQNQKAHEEEHRRPSSYHSFSQSPPYGCQYEERRNGKQSAFLSRKPGSDRGHEGKISGYSYSSHSLHERMFQDGFTGESCGPRTSNCSGSSTGDTAKSAPQSPNFPDSICFSPPVLQDQSNIQSSCGLTSSQRTVSAGNIDSISLKSGKSSLSDLIFEDDNVHRTETAKNSAAPSFMAFPDDISAPNQDIFDSKATQEHHVTTTDQSVDLFSNMLTETPSADKVIPAAPSMDNAGWATFDTPPEQKQPALTGLSYVATTSIDKQAPNRDLFSFESNAELTWFQSSKDDTSVTSQNQSTATSLDTGSSQPWSTFDASSASTQYTVKGDLSLMTSTLQEPKRPIDRNCSQLWHSFDDANEVVCAKPRIEDHSNVVSISLSTSNPFMCSVVSEESYDDDSQKVFMDELSPNTSIAASADSSLGGPSNKQMPLNPFDLPFDTQLGTPDLFMDVSSLQEPLPSPDLPAFLDGLPERWFPSSSCAYDPSASHGGLPCLVEQGPNFSLRNIPVGTVSTGNPFV
ncbi:hypothetical protein BDA96_01G412600 [Sorghum bicolor]|nr:hypothetical protein BDA96_01G412600 [Sorghum bicolor]